MTPISSSKDTQAIVKDLFTEIQSEAKNKNFARAEELREKILELSPMSLTEIINSADIIEKEKTAGLDTTHLTLWNKLYQELNTEERNCLFYSMNKIKVEPQKLILSQNSLNNKLFFLDQGQVTVFKQDNGKNKIITNLGSGELLREYSFCSISLCSASVASLTPSHLYCLDRSIAEKWEATQPSLMNKLLDFCKEEGHMKEIAKMNIEEESTCPKYTFDGVINANLLTKKGKKTNTNFRGSLTNISQIGTCFHFKCNKERTARALLAQYLLLSISIKINNKPINFKIVGKINQVSFHLYSDYSLHVQFNKSLPDNLLKIIRSTTEDL